jgi:hypothetical protein
MEDAVKKTLLESMTDETDDDILSVALDNAESVILNRLYPFGADGTILPTRYGYLQVRIAAYFLNKRGAEGEVQHNENNVYRYYESGDVPNSLLDEIVPFAGAIR